MFDNERNRVKGFVRGMGRVEKREKMRGENGGGGGRFRKGVKKATIILCYSHNPSRGSDEGIRLLLS